jgi:hypothetical protein
MGLDAQQLKVTALRAAKQYAAMRKTIKGDCEGRVVVSRRNKIAGEKGRAIHGKAIANMMADKGHDAFDYPASIDKAALHIVDSSISDAIKTAFNTARADIHAVKKALLEGAKYQMAWVKKYILSGGLGTVAKSTERQKRSLARKGRAAPSYVKTYGVRTFRFVRGIRESFKQIYSGVKK